MYATLVARTVERIVVMGYGLVQVVDVYLLLEGLCLDIC